MDNNRFKIKIKTSIITIFMSIMLTIVTILTYFQYRSSNEFAMLTTQQEFDKLSNEMVNKIKQYDFDSLKFIKIAQSIKDADSVPTLDQQHVLLKIITEYISASNYVYGIYLGFQDDTFYIVYNLNLSNKMRQAQKAPNNARWLIKKNLKDQNGNFVS